ncbi:metal-dependent transcriptional regulator [Neolewinella aurantiaca]|uniref:Transcriptional regulator MntR n=1 Tax=Neolewinella aurantiaca TaxID=2602767 RepID=A0A5C7FTY7_9BACT|nr:metal-dependent transcriptional regulator [Neolewinella aurantiaca]TXF91614.1 metal-dependent transcriptional regulator [Neolewinella aurantiaca]
MATVTEENYLKALISLADAEDKVAVSELSRALGVSKPSANSMVRKLADAGLVRYEKYKPLRLTAAGRKAAALIVRKHRLTEMFLVERMGFGWEEVHAIAEQIEHVKSPVFFSRMDELMGFPTIDPHGSPIPDKDGNYVKTHHRRLSDCDSGQTVTIVALAHDSNEFLHFLNDRDLKLKSVLTIHHREAFDGSLTVSYSGHDNVVFSKIVADRILVR